MNKFIAYFDYLGFKEFIENNDIETQNRIVGNNLRDMESALGKGNVKVVPQGLIADISKSRIHCLNFSDTVVFFTEDNSLASLIEILDVAYKFNYTSTLFCFPVRGAMVFGEIEKVAFEQINSMGGSYNINSVFGKGLINAHLISNNQNWAGTVLDESFTNQISEMGENVNEILKHYTKKYKVPYKTGFKDSEEFVLNIIENASNAEALKNNETTIRNNFAQYNKPIDHPDVQLKLENTIKFLQSYYS